MTLNPNNETELHGIAVVLLCDELTVWRDAYVTSWPVPSWLYDDMTAWRDDRVTSWLVAFMSSVGLITGSAISFTPCAWCSLIGRRTNAAVFCSRPNVYSWRSLTRRLCTLVVTADLRAWSRWCKSSRSTPSYPSDILPAACVYNNFIAVMFKNWNRKKNETGYLGLKPNRLEPNLKNPNRPSSSRGSMLK